MFSLPRWLPVRKPTIPTDLPWTRIDGKDAVRIIEYDAAELITLMCEIGTWELKSMPSRTQTVVINSNGDEICVTRVARGTHV